MLALLGAQCHMHVTVQVQTQDRMLLQSCRVMPQVVMRLQP